MMTVPLKDAGKLPASLFSRRTTMGLTIHYTMRLPSDRSRAEVLTRLAAVRARAAEQPVEYVSPVFDISDGVISDDEETKRAQYWLMHASEYVADPYVEEGKPRYIGDPESTIGFTVYPGEGSEPATFALLRRRCETDGSEEWYWWCACKTQYACNEGEDHFVAVHTSLIAMLDAALEAGLELDVHDEGDYWETRSRGKLLGHVRKMNHIVAALGGALADALGDDHDVQAEIFKNPRFERLEMGESP
jgi:hypothetical protein